MRSGKVIGDRCTHCNISLILFLCTRQWSPMRIKLNTSLQFAEACIFQWNHTMETCTWRLQLKCHFFISIGHVTMATALRQQTCTRTHVFVMAWPANKEHAVTFASKNCNFHRLSVVYLAAWHWPYHHCMPINLCPEIEHIVFDCKITVWFSFECLENWRFIIILVWPTSDTAVNRNKMPELVKQKNYRMPNEEKTVVIF